MPHPVPHVAFVFLPGRGEEITRYGRLSRLWRSTYDALESLSVKEIDISARFFGYLFVKSVLHWNALTVIKITAEDTNASNRNFIQSLFRFLGMEMGVGNLQAKLQHSGVTSHGGLFPRDNLIPFVFTFHLLRFFHAVVECEATACAASIPRQHHGRAACCCWEDGHQLG